MKTIKQISEKSLSQRAFFIAITVLTLASVGFGYWLGKPAKTVSADELVNLDGVIDELAQEQLKSRDAYLSAKESALYDLELKMNHMKKGISEERDQIYLSKLNK